MSSSLSASASRRSYPPAACAFNPTCTVALVSTIAGVRPFELVGAADSTSTSIRSGPVAHSLLPPEATANGGNGSAAAAAASSSSPRALWDTPVYMATIAGDSALVAVVFRARPAVFARATHTFTASDLHGADPAAPSLSSTTAAGEAAGVPPWGESGLSSVPSRPDTEVFAAEAEYRRYVYLFDGTTGHCLAALHFCGSPVAALRANTAVLLVAAVDLFHIVELDTLRYVRQQSMYKPQNPRSVLDLSSAVALRPRKLVGAVPALSYTSVVAFPQSARGYQGDVTVLTLHKTPSPAPTDTALDTGAAPLSSAPPLSPGIAAQAAAAVQQRTIPAHHHAVAHLRLRRDGSLLVTASQLGTTLKVFDCVTGALLVELQRGHRPAAVLSLAVDHDAHRVAALSTNATLHVFNCAAVVQSWEAGRRWNVEPPVGAAAAAAAATSSSSLVSKTRAEWKWKVPPVQEAHSTHTTTSPTAAAAENGGVQHVVGFAADGRTVWVAQVESTDTQLAHAAAVAAGRSSPSGGRRRCIGRLTRFPVVSAGRVSGGGAAAAAREIGNGASGTSFSIEL